MPHELIDFRSDTVTRPTPAMRKAMAEAEVGDDVFGEDPTVNALQDEVAALFGKQAALFVSSGTMANQVALKAHTQSGDEVVAHPQAHIVRAESAGGAALSGVHFRTVGNADGTVTAEQVLGVYQAGDDPHYAPTRLVCLENTHNACGGKAIGLAGIEAVARVARAKRLALHLDGARVLNACIALDVKPARMAAPFDSLTLCFSKGLGAPVGSIIAGRRDFIARCTRFRKMFGGGTRQAGILAAAARHALAHHVERLAEDHANARRLAEGLLETGQVELPYGLPETNIVFFRATSPQVSQERLADA
ncbi:MAG: aminotransferase class I/II-fold pyridoxal phosphate-dependent enzyme, partial [Candidatus Lambdaproteobacteria bacterium]|nr:aminotransferase class I/II-fold pyridoxal phosphate-dependent enzyme [Candidatus Lambdaproteobacteria bacterium]